jgi:hypothetical protein
MDNDKLAEVPMPNNAEALVQDAQRQICSLALMVPNAHEREANFFATRLSGTVNRLAALAAQPKPEVTADRAALVSDLIREQDLLIDSYVDNEVLADKYKEQFCRAVAEILRVSAQAADSKEDEATDSKRLAWLLPNLHPANFGLEFEGGYEWDNEAEYLRKWRSVIDSNMKGGEA